MMPSTSSQLSPICCATAEVAASRSQSITTASNGAVNRERLSLHGAATCLTLCRSQSTRGISAARIVRYSHVSR